MKLMRNPELRRELRQYLIGTVLFSITGFFLKPACALLCLAAGIFFTLLHFYSARKRYAAIEELSRSIDRILHGQESPLITECEEGELSILSSEIRKMAVRLQESADLLLADKLRLTDAIADISHQLRTPLTSMNLMVSLLADNNIPEGKRLKLTQELKKQLSRISWLVETLLKISKIDAGTITFRKDTVPVSELIRKAAEPLEIPMELKNQSLDVSVRSETFYGDFFWCVEALGNILKNCTEHTPCGGRIQVSVQETVLFTEIAVHDSGNGFAKEDIPRLFERFYKGQDADSESVGIGLALSRMIITEQNGTISAGNAPDGGARFTVRFYKNVI